MRRIGFTGTENSHTDHFIRFLNTEERHPDFRATALAGGHSARNEISTKQSMRMVEPAERTLNVPGKPRALAIRARCWR